MVKSKNNGVADGIEINQGLTSQKQLPIMPSAAVVCLLCLLELATMPLMASGQTSVLAKKPDMPYRVDAKGRTLHDILAEVEQKGGPKTHYETGFGKITLQGKFTAEGWHDLIRQLLAGYNYYMVTNGKGSQVKDVFIVDNTTGDGSTNDEQTAITTANDVATPCTDGGPSRMPFGHKGPLSMMRQRSCGGEQTPVR